MNLDSIAGITTVAVADNQTLFTLWTKYGRWESEAPVMFERRSVQRQDAPHRASHRVVVPASYTVLNLSVRDRQEYDLAVSGILIRDDYLKSLYDICHFATHRKLPPQNDDPPAEFYKPFLNNGVPTTRNAITLLGHPGIGKSLWVIIVLVLRVLAGCPTILHSTSNICYIFNEVGLYQVHLDQLFVQKGLFYAAISPEYWCLVDSNRSVPDVHYLLSHSSAFIVQAASPRSERINWAKKYHFAVGTYFMKNWLLGELIMGRTLQGGLNPCSEQALEVFCSRYAPSARMAYAYANDLELYEGIVNKDLAQLTFETLGQMVSSTAAFQMENMSHHILLVSPQRNRINHSITMSSRYMFHKLRDQLHVHTLEGAARLYQIFVRNQYTKGAAGYILDDVHDLFCEGGQWRITPLTKNKPGHVNTHFKSAGPVAKKSSYIRLGYLDSGLAIANRILPADTSPLAHHQYLLGENIHLQNGYYQAAPGQPTFDGFIYDTRTQTAIMLQMTVATQHDAKVQGVKWLLNQGAKEIHLVAVKPPNTSLDLSIPNNLVPPITDVFELVLESVVQLASSLTLQE